MKARITIIITIVLVGIIIVAAVRTHTTKPVITQPVPGPSTLVATATYACNEGKTINAKYYEAAKSSTPVVPGEPPIPTGSVAVVLSDGRSLTLAQTISASGIRYANPDESFVFWSKGNGALVLEHNQEKSYIGCVAVKPDTGGLPRVYQNGTDGFSLRYPAGYVVDASYRYQEFGPGKDIYGVKFTIPPAIDNITNLSEDTYLSVELLPQTQTCTADRFLDDPRVVAKNVTDNGTDYSVASSTGAAAGNRYEETVYAIPGTNPCIAVRYFIHYGVLENYPVGSVEAFDRKALLGQFDQIRRTLTVAP